MTLKEGDIRREGDTETLLDNRRWVEGRGKGWLVLEEFREKTKGGQLVRSTEKKRMKLQDKDNSGLEV
jgi:hypothetical protein